MFETGAAAPKHDCDSNTMLYGRRRPLPDW